MEACIYKKFGKAFVLEWVDGWPKPECKSDSVLQALRDICDINQGKKVLITGASGGVGHFAIQIARRLGSELTARLKISRKNRLVLVHSSYKDLNQLADWINKGELSAHIQKIYEKNEIVNAHTQIQSGHTRGKIVVSMQS